MLAACSLVMLGINALLFFTSLMKKIPAPILMASGLLVALVGLTVLLVTGTMSWQAAASERSAWDVFVWYGGMLRMGELLNNTGSTRVLAEHVASWFVGIPWIVVLVAILLIFFYAHYFFASITAHMLAMFPPFVAVLPSSTL